MNDCQSDCFWSFETLIQVIAGAFIGAAVITLMGCLVSGTLILTDAGLACIATVTAGVIGGWIVGAILGALLAAMLAYGHCQEACAGFGAVPPADQDQGLTTEPAEAMSCDDAREALKQAEAALAGAEGLESKHRITSNTAARAWRNARTANHLALAIAAGGAMWSSYVLLAGLILVPITTLVQSVSRVKAVQAGVLGPGFNTLVRTRRKSRDRAQKLVDKLCGRLESSIRSGSEQKEAT